MRATTLLISLAVMSGLYAQPMRQSSPDEIIEFAYENLEKQDYIVAIDFLNQAYDQDNENLQVAFDLAKTYEKIRDYKKAERWYRNLNRKDKEISFPESRLRYARMLKVANKYEEASDAFYEFLTSSENDSLKSIARNELEGIEIALSADEPLDLMISNENVAVNTMFSEYSPSYDTDGSMYYSGFNRKDIIIVDGSEDDYHAKIYKAAAPEAVEEKKEEEQTTRRRRGGKKKKAASEPLGNHINREGYHTSNVSISSDGERMYFTRAILESNRVLESQIYMSRKAEGGWSPPDILPRVNDDYISTMPIEGELYGNRVLYFCSNRPGGEGGFDIYYSTIRGDDFSQPVNLGAVVNSPGDEYTPFYRTGILYFSSDYYPGLGAFDVFSSSWNGAEWSQPQNLGKGYNSSVDDLYFRIDESGYNGFVVSNRPGTKSTLSETCCDDIFMISKKQLVIDLLAGVVDENNTALEGATMKLVDITSGVDGETKVQSQDRDYLFKFPLDEERMYKIVVTRPGYVTDSVSFDSKGITENYTIQKKVTLKKIEVPEEDKKDDVAIITRNQPIRLRNIYYDFDDDKILPDAEKDLNTLHDLLSEYPTMVIELSSHTDAQGNDDYNQKLSQRRSNSARQWLLDKGVNPERIVARGYGEEFILNDCVNGVECEDEQHRYNRRTEFKIIAGPKTIEIKVGGDAKGSGGGIPSDRVEIPRLEIGGPELHCDRPKVDLGTIQFGEKKSHTYIIVNTGDQDLIIEHASACTCTEVDWPIDPIIPGAKAKVTITYDSSKKDEGERYGKQEVMVETITNLPERFYDFEFVIFVEE